MTRSIRGRRGRMLLAGMAVGTALLVSGCGSGQIAETAKANPGVPGVSAATSDGRFKVVNLALAYPGPEGYPAGADAPLQVVIYNDSLQPATVEVSTADARAVVLGGEPTASPTAVAPTSTDTPTAAGTSSPTGAAGSPAATATPTTGATTDPAATAAPTTAPVPTGPARVNLPAADALLLNGVSGATQLRLVGLGRALAPGDAVTIVFDFGGEQLELSARIAIPLTPLPRQAPDGAEQHG